MGAVLHPLAEADTFCAIDMPFLPGEPDGFHQSTFGFEHLTDPVRQVFKVKLQRADSRNSEDTLEYWEAQEGELRSLFSISSGESIGFMGGVSSAEVTLEGGYPRVLRIDESSEACGRFVDLPSGATSYEGGCTKAENTARWCYQPVKENQGHFVYAPCSEPGAAQPTMTRRTPRASSSAGSRSRWSPCSTRDSSSTAPPQPSEPFSALSHTSSSGGRQAELLHHRHFLAAAALALHAHHRARGPLRSSAFAGAFTGTGLEGSSSRLPASAANGLWNGAAGRGGLGLLVFLSHDACRLSGGPPRRRLGGGSTRNAGAFASPPAIARA